MRISARFTSFVALLICVLTLSACTLLEPAKPTPAPPPVLSLPHTDSPFHLGDLVYDEAWNNYELEFGFYPWIDGDEGCLPLARAFAKFHLKLSEKDLSDFIDFTPDYMLYFAHNTYGGKTFLREQGVEMMDKPIDLLLCTEPSKKDLDLAKENGVDLLIEPIALDAAVLYVSQENPVDSLTQEEIRGIYSGKITNWKEVGGNDLPIIAYQDGDREGRYALYNQVMQGESFAEGPTREKTMGSGIPGGNSYTISYPDVYSNDADAIGYGVMALRKDMDGIKMLAVDGVQPDVASMQSGAYPLIVTYNAILNAKDKDGQNGKFLDWILSEEGRQCIQEAGYALPD